MAANINLHQPRVEVALTERDENNNGDPATSGEQTPSQSESTIAAPSAQHGQSGDGGGSEAETHDSSAPLPQSIDNETSKPSFMRYGFGDTVIMGAPNYARDYAVNSSKFEQHLEPAEPIPRVATPMPKPGSTNPSTLTPIPMPKPGGITSPTPALASPQSLSKPAYAPTHNAPQMGGAPVAAPAANTSTPEPGSNDLAFEQGMADLTLGDPLNKELIARYEQDHPNTNLVEHGNATADHLVATYGETRLNDMAKLHQALARVRGDYLNALTAAEANCALNIDGRFLKVQSGTSGDGGTEAPVFDNEAFTRWYVQQDGLSNRAFAANYAYGGVGTVTHSQGDNTVPLESTVLSGGTSVIVHERMETSSEGGTSVNVPRFAAPGLFILGGPTCGIELHDPKAVWFDPTLGFVTSETNVVVKDDFMDRAMPIIMAVGFMAVTGVPSTQFVEAGVIAADSAIAAGAINGAIGSFVFTGATGGEITFKGILQGALTGGIMGGLSTLPQYQTMQNLGLNTTTGTVTSYALRAVSITGQATLQGALRELVGGRFRDGFTQGIAQGLAGEITRALNGDVAGRLARQEITPEQARVLNQMTTMTGSAIRAAANPNDPAFAFAQDYLTQLLGTPSVPEVRGTVFDDDGNLTPGIVNTKAPLEDQSRQIYDALVSRGMKPDEAASLAGDYYDRTWLANVQNAPPTLTDPVAIRQRMDEIDEALRQQIRAQELNEASLGGGELLEVGGGSGNGARPPAQISTNRGVENALNLAADPAGVLGPMQELRGDFATLDRIKVEDRINNYRQQLIDLGVPNVPTGYAENIGGPDGRISRDYSGTLDSLERAYTNHLENARYSSQYGDGWKDIRIGRSNMTVQEFEQQVFRRTQASVDDAYTRGRQRMSDGSLPITYNENFTLGRYIDEQTRSDMRAFALAEGIPDNQGSQFMAVNRRITGANGTYGIPDLRLGNNLLVDYTLANKTPYSSQIRSWANIQPLTGVLIVRPTAYGGSYVIPPITIPKPKPPKG
jgi:hypothetical protein